MANEYIRKVDAVDALKALEEPAPTARHLSAIFDCEDAIKSIEPADVVPICQTGCKGCKRENNLVIGSCRLCARFYEDMYEGIE